MNITQEQLNQLSRIYNTLLEIQTKGEDTLIMADCLRALQETILSIKENDIKKEQLKWQEKNYTPLQ